MRTTKIYFAMAAVLLLTLGCQKEELVPTGPLTGTEIEGRASEEVYNLTLTPAFYNIRRLELGETETIEVTLKSLEEETICGRYYTLFLNFGGGTNCTDFLQIFVHKHGFEDLDGFNICLEPGEEFVFYLDISVSAVCEEYEPYPGYFEFGIITTLSPGNVIYGYTYILFQAGPVLPSELTAYFQEALENGKLYMAKDNQLHAFLQQLSLVEHFYANENLEAACAKLEWLLDRCDGNSAPPDWIEGEDKEAFARFIGDVMYNLGCE